MAHGHILSDLEFLVPTPYSRQWRFGREMAYGHIFCNVVDFIRPAPDPLERGAGTLRFFPLIYRGLHLGRAVERRLYGYEWHLLLNGVHSPHRRGARGRSRAAVVGNPASRY